MSGAKGTRSATQKSLEREGSRGMRENELTRSPLYGVRFGGREGGLVARQTSTPLCSVAL